MRGLTELYSNKYTRWVAYGNNLRYWGIFSFITFTPLYFNTNFPDYIVSYLIYS
jgi:hypothetical protein